MKWATRDGIHIDRASSAWLLRRFVDPDAEFVFVDDPDDVPADATPSTCVAWSTDTVAPTAPSRPSCAVTASTPSRAGCR